jgi:hypothetical protein
MPLQGTNTIGNAFLQPVSVCSLLHIVPSQLADNNYYYIPRTITSWRQAPLLTRILKAMIATTITTLFNNIT